MSAMREKVKVLVDQLSEEQVTALLVILQPLICSENEITPLEAEETVETRNDIKNGKGIKVEDVRREIGILNKFLA